VSEQERGVDDFGVDAAIVHRLKSPRVLHQAAGCLLRVGEGTVGSVLHCGASAGVGCRISEQFAVSASFVITAPAQAGRYLSERGPVALIAPFPRVRLGSSRRKRAPCSLEVGAGGVKRVGSAVGLLARFRTPIETAETCPSRNSAGIAGSARDLSDVHVRCENLPAVGTVRVAAPDQLSEVEGHGPI
jgi:hypothetical protein